jgi:hypothetical protein
MLRSLRGLQGIRVRARDSDVGQVGDFYLEDLGCLVRYYDPGERVNREYEGRP